MWKRGLVLAAVLAGMAVTAPSVFAQNAASPTSQKKDPKELVIRIKNTSVEDLKKLSFLELNILKNAVYAAKGYKFADDRPWLNQIFCEQRYRKVKKSGLAAGRAALESWASKLRGQAAWDLDAYEFPACKDAGVLDADQMRALANIRMALFKKIDSLGSIRAIDSTLDNEITGLQKQGDFVWILGKAVPMCTAEYCMQDNTRRELHGYNRLLQLVKNVENFDAMELLGLYTGDILFIRSILEAKYGKPHEGVLSWEISQLVGVTERKAGYDPKKLPVNVQVLLQMLDDVVQKIVQSDLNDVPASFKGKTIEFLDPYNGGAC
ncbi:MAG: hypothetical protein ACYC7L_10470 [Nitrospirota bacterium]